MPDQTIEPHKRFQMSLITVAHLAKSYGPNDIFSGVSFAIPKGARAAIVGPNGIGKTTLLRILWGRRLRQMAQSHARKTCA